MARVLIAGCGYVGAALAARLRDAGDAVWGLRRHAAPLPEGVAPLVADLTDPATLRALPRDLDALVLTASPDDASAEAYAAAYVDGPRALLDALDAQGARPPRLIMTSSTGVYPQTGGVWVDEDTPAHPSHPPTQRLRDGERLWSEAGGVVLRLAGIYGPGRVGLLDRVAAGQAPCHAGPPIYSNRIHRDDCAGALAHLLTLDAPDPLYNGVDAAPEDRCVVLRWLARALDAPTPPLLDRAALSGRAARSNKRCRNDRLLASGYTLRYPTWREGYAPLIAARQRPAAR